MLTRRYPHEIRPYRECKRQKIKAIDWPMQYDNDARTILQNIDLVDLIYNPTEYLHDYLKAQCQYDRVTCHAMKSHHLA
jgi:hypothetical protein